MTSVMITGIAGFIGSNLAENLISRGYNLIGVDNFSSGKKVNIKPFIKKIKLFKTDIRNLKTLRKAMKGVDYVLHHAAMPSVPYSVEHPLETSEVNVQGTFNVLLAARDAGVKKVVFASSAAVYGNTKKIPINENQNLNPLSPYAAHKIIGEYYCKLFYNSYGLRTTSLRYFNVYGPRQDPNSQYAAVIPNFLSLMRRGKRPIIFGDGMQTRDFISVMDVLKANLLAIKNKKSDGKAYNIASGKKTSVLDLVRMMNKEMNTDIKPVFQHPRLGDVKHSVASISKAKKAMGFTPSYNISKSLKLLL